MNEMKTKTSVRNYSLRLIGLSALLTLALAASGAHRFASASKSAAAGPVGSAGSPAMQVPRPWTAVASTGAVDESSLLLFDTTGASFGFRGANGAIVGARYNVTNTFDNNADPNMPGWNTLELGSTAPGAGASRATAILWQVDPCTGQQVELCRARNHGEVPIPICETCNFGVPIDFGQFLYYVELKLERNNQNLQPLAHTLRIY